MSAARVASVLVMTVQASAAAAQTPAHLHGGSSDGDHALTTSFIEDAREATRRYHDRAVAIADGFRLLGPDFPAMGEHWVHPGRMVEGRLDVTRPQALSYAVIDGRPVLTGVIYAKPLVPGEALPAFPAPGFPWHDHGGTIDEESVLLHHVPTAGDGAGGVRLTMLHAWIWVDNPDGIFSADNWALPFIRVGLAVPERVPPDAARMLSLLSGGDRYFRMLVRALARPTPQEEAAVVAHLADGRDVLAAWLADKTRHSAPDGALDAAVGGPLGDAALHELEARWQALWRDIAAVLRPEAAARLHPMILP